ncbi:DUF3969 family protein [Listeria booriae]|uniref:DUF3969 family protein n=1 Tax=Listeria booriae TaxID=1552123 RepID=UPI001626DF42|nr:DUF3969 family protein [Listeria booriae]MBC2034750.1 DUF3969 family protein [Listeria booriae]
MKPNNESSKESLETLERIIIALITGISVLLKEKVISIEEAENFLFSPYSSETLKGMGLDAGISNLIIDEGCSLEDIESLMPEHLDKSIDSIKDQCMAIYKNLAKPKLPAPNWIEEITNIISIPSRAGLKNELKQVYKVLSNIACTDSVLSKMLQKHDWIPILSIEGNNKNLGIIKEGFWALKTSTGFIMLDSPDKYKHILGILKKSTDEINTEVSYSMNEYNISFKNKYLFPFTETLIYVLEYENDEYWLTNAFNWLDSLPRYFQLQFTHYVEKIKNDKKYSESVRNKAQVYISRLLGESRPAKLKLSLSFEEKQLINSDFQNLEIINSSFSQSNLDSASFVNSILNNVDLSGASLENVDFSNATMECVNFDGACIENIIFQNTRFNSIDNINSSEIKSIIVYSENSKKIKHGEDALNWIVAEVTRTKPDSI